VTLQTEPARPHPRLSMAELVAFVAALMAMNALSVDIMLPAFGQIAEDYALADPNRAQLVVVVYLGGFGISQLFIGPLSDRFGRKGVLLITLAAYAAAVLLNILAPSYDTLLAARFLQGVFAAGSRVIAVALVRDLVSGRVMAKVMSMAMMVFMAAPILAPALGQLILLGAGWRWIFGALLIIALIMIVWVSLRLPETLREEDRQSLRPMGVARNYILALSNRVTLGYMIASLFLFGGLFSFIVTAQQIMAVQYNLGEWFPLAFAGIAGVLAVANFVNSRLVTGLGMRRLSHAALIGFIAISAIQSLLALFGPVGFVWFYLPLLGVMALFGLIGANFSALIMEPAAQRAGVTAAMQGAVTSSGSAVLGGIIGAAYDGTILPLVLGNAILGALALVAVAITERGRLFTPSEAELANL